MLGLVMGGLADFYLGCIMTLPAAYMGFIPFIHWLRVGADIEQGKILKTCGVVIQSNRALHRGDRDLQYIRIDQQKFAISGEHFFALKNGEPYCIYYSPRTKYILSVKSISNPNEHYDGKS